MLLFRSWWSLEPLYADGAEMGKGNSAKQHKQEAIMQNVCLEFDKGIVFQISARPVVKSNAEIKRNLRTASYLETKKWVSIGARF